MIELPLIFVAGLLGSSHCVGMCGPFALLIGGAAPSWRSSLFRQSLYSIGRVFTYSIFGAFAGYIGIRFANVSSIVNAPALLSIVAGLFLVYQGFSTAGVKLFSRAMKADASSTCLAGGLLLNFLKSPSRVDLFLAGVLTGFLPCGLVYGFVGIAASTQDILMGMLIMISFGLGTIPVMVATGHGARVMPGAIRQRIMHYAAWCVVVAGLISIVRGVSFVGCVTTAEVTEACPLCP